MTIIYITIILLLVAAALFLIGKLWLAKYAFKYSAGLGIAVLLIPGATAYFSFYKLEREGKELFVSLWLAGLAIALVTVAAFFAPLQDMASGKAWEEGYGANTGILGSSTGSNSSSDDSSDSEPEAKTEEPAKVEEPAKTEEPAVDADAGAAPADGDAGAAAPADGDAGAAAPADKAPEGTPADKAAAPADKAAAPADKAAEKPADAPK